MRITILHNLSRDASFGLNAVLGAGGKGSQPRSHPLVKVFEFGAADLIAPARLAAMEPLAVMEAVYRALNVGTEPGHSVAGSRERKVATRYRARRLRSLCVGDVVIAGFDGAACLAVAPVGFTVVPEQDLMIVDARTAVPLIRERFQLTPGEPLAITVPWED
jgi:hypothetical protein